MIIYYLIFINIIELLLMGLDKQLAIKHKGRIPEIVLLSLSFLGGSIGAILGMQLFRHKTKKWKFKILFPLFLLMHIILIINT